MKRTADNLGKAGSLIPAPGQYHLSQLCRGFESGSSLLPHGVLFRVEPRPLFLSWAVCVRTGGVGCSRGQCSLGLYTLSPGPTLKSQRWQLCGRSRGSLPQSGKRLAGKWTRAGGARHCFPGTAFVTLGTQVEFLILLSSWHPILISPPSSSLTESPLPSVPLPIHFTCLKVYFKCSWCGIAVIHLVSRNL